MLPILELPTELLRYICTFLDIKSKLQLEQTCHRFREIVLDATLYRNIILDNHSLTDVTANDVLDKLNHTVVQCISLWHCHNINGILFKSALYLFTTVTEIELSGTAINNENLVFIWQESSKYKTLHILRFMDCEFLNDDITSAISCHHPSLKELQIASHLSQATAIHFAKFANFLVLFDAGGVVFTKEQVKNVLDFVPLLKTLSLPNALIDDGDLSELVPFLLGIEILHIEDSDVTKTGQQYLQKTLPNLTVFV